MPLLPSALGTRIRIGQVGIIRVLDSSALDLAPGFHPRRCSAFLEPRSRASGSYDDFCDLRNLAVKQLWAKWTVRSEPQCNIAVQLS